MENNSGAALEAANEIHGTSNEGLVPSALTFRNNTVKSEGISSKYVPLKIYSWNAQLGEQACIDGVLIENNTIDVRFNKYKFCNRTLYAKQHNKS